MLCVLLLTAASSIGQGFVSNCSTTNNYYINWQRLPGEPPPPHQRPHGRRGFYTTTAGKGNNMVYGLTTCYADTASASHNVLRRLARAPAGSVARTTGSLTCHKLVSSWLVTTRCHLSPPLLAQQKANTTLQCLGNFCPPQKANTTLFQSKSTTRPRKNLPSPS